MTSLGLCCYEEASCWPSLETAVHCPLTLMHSLLLTDLLAALREPCYETPQRLNRRVLWELLKSQSLGVPLLSTTPVLVAEPRTLVSLASLGGAPSHYGILRPSPCSSGLLATGAVRAESEAASQMLTMILNTEGPQGSVCFVTEWHANEQQLSGKATYSSQHLVQRVNE